MSDRSIHNLFLNAPEVDRYAALERRLRDLERSIAFGRQWARVEEIGETEITAGLYGSHQRMSVEVEVPVDGWVHLTGGCTFRIEPTTVNLTTAVAGFKELTDVTDPFSDGRTVVFWQKSTSTQAAWSAQTTSSPDGLRVGVPYAVPFVYRPTPGTRRYGFDFAVSKAGVNDRAFVSKLWLCVEVL